MRLLLSMVPVNCLYLASQFSSVQSLSRVRLCDPMNRSTPGFPVHHQLLEFTQTHVHRVSDAIQTSHPLSSPSPPVPNPSQHQSFPMSQLFAWGGQSIEVSASVLSMNTQDWSPLGPLPLWNSIISTDTRELQFYGSTSCCPAWLIEVARSGLLRDASGPLSSMSSLS